MLACNDFTGADSNAVLQTMRMPCHHSVVDSLRCITNLLACLHAAPNLTTYNPNAQAKFDNGLYSEPLMLLELLMAYERRGGGGGGDGSGDDNGQRKHT